MKALIGDDPADFAELANTFLAEGEQIVTSMRTCVEQEDAKSLGRHAHSLKAGATDFGALLLASQCEKFEVECKAGLPEDALQQTEKISSSWADAHDAIRAHLAS